MSKSPASPPRPPRASAAGAWIEPLEGRRLLAAGAGVAAPDATLLGWGLNVYQKTNASLQVPGTGLYAETASLDGTRSGGDGGFSFVWPAATQFRVLNALVRVDPAAYRPALRSYSDQLRSRYLRTAAPGGYRSGVGAGAAVFYDDNAHLVVALAEAYQLTRDTVYLDRAVETYNFVLTGEDAAGGGGIYFSETDHTSKDAISTLQAVRGGLLLYQITGQARYLTDAKRLYGWATTHIQQSDGLFRERWKLTGAGAGASDGFTLINSAGIGLACNLLFYDTTGEPAYLAEAQRIGRASLPRYFNSTTGAINDEGFWAFELVDALDELSLHDHSATWVNAVKRALNWLHANRQDPNGHYDTLWGRGGFQGETALTSWDLNDQAPVAQSYLYTAADSGLWTGAAVATRAVFYNNSAYDGNDPAPGPADDGAIAADKSALLPAAGAATFANVTNSTRGINGIIIDLAGVPAGLTASPSPQDFVVRTSGGGTSAWAAAPSPAAVAVRRGAGAGGSDRVTLVWPDNTFRNTWVRITVAANSRTGLALPDVFYFGNLAGDAVNSGGTPTVDAADVLVVRQNFHSITPAALAGCDLNRDGIINALDIAVGRANQGHSLPLLTTAAAPAAASVGEALVTSPTTRTRARPPRRGLFDEHPAGVLA